MSNSLIGLKRTINVRKLALLLHNAGERLFDIYNAEKKDTDKMLETMRKVLDDYFIP